jgi:hypothetical protein
MNKLESKMPEAKGLLRVIQEHNAQMIAEWEQDGTFQRRARRFAPPWWLALWRRLARRP